MFNINYIFKKIRNISFSKKLDFSLFINELTKKIIKEIYIKNNKLIVIRNDNTRYNTYIPNINFNLLKYLIKNNIKITTINDNNLFINLIFYLIIYIFLFSIIYFFIKYFKNIFNNFIFNKNKLKILSECKTSVKFSDIAGCDEAIEEVKELVFFLKNINKYKNFKCRIPKGLLLIGPPGTGKTLLAKAIAGESNVPFFNISGSEFVEMFVGVGAARVRHIFNKAKRYSPSIIFIDEIDSVGRNRGYNINNGSDEREQTLNQMLIEMDGFKKSESVVVIAATNRPEILDKALLRSGRFDRKVFIDLPDINGREQILNIYTKDIPLNKDVDIKILSKSTIGFSGADLSNLVNESVLNAIKNNKNNISMYDFENAKDKIILGPERKTLFISDIDKEITAYHEAGHVIVSKFTNYDDLVYKVSIIPRNNSLGITSFLPNDNKLNINKEKLENKISILYGGRLAEEIIYGYNKITIGSFNDIREATSIAKNMILRWGYSKNICPMVYNNNYDYLEINNEYKDYISENKLKIIDKEISYILNKNINKAKNILIKNIDILHKMKDQLIKNETLDSKQIDDIINNKI